MENTDMGEIKETEKTEKKEIPEVKDKWYRNLPSLNIKANIAKLFSKWSVEFSVFLGLVFTLYDTGLVDFWLLKAYVGIALTAFFIAVMVKFAIAVYKDSAKAIVESRKCIEHSKKSPEKEIPGD